MLAIQGNPTHPGLPISGQRSPQLRPAWAADLRTSLGSTTGLPTSYTATTAGRLCPDHGGILRRVNAGEARFWGARRVENLVPDTGFSPGGSFTGTLTEIEPGVWEVTGMGTAGTFGIIKNTAIGQPLIGRKAVASIWLRARVPEDVGRWISIGLERYAGGGVLGSQLRRCQLTADWKRFTVRDVPISTDPVHAGWQFRLHSPASGSDPATDCLMRGLQVEEVGVNAPLCVPSEYVQPGVNYGVSAGGAVTGVRYFDYALGNTVPSGDAADGGEVVEARGAPIPDSVLLGFYAEPPVTNVAVSPFNPPASGWTLDGVTWTGLVEPSPDGRLDGTTITCSAGNVTHRAYTTTVHTKGAAAEYWCASIYAKAGTHSHVQLLAAATGTADYVRVHANLSTGAVVTAAAAGTWTLVASGCEDAGNGWYRVWASGLTDTGTTIRPLVYVVDAAGTFIWNAAGTETIHVWGAHLHLGQVPLSVTEGTKGADAFVQYGSYFPDLIGNYVSLEYDASQSFKYTDIVNWANTGPRWFGWDSNEPVLGSAVSGNLACFMSLNVPSSLTITALPTVFTNRAEAKRMRYRHTVGGTRTGAVQGGLNATGVCTSPGDIYTATDAARGIAWLPSSGIVDLIVRRCRIWPIDLGQAWAEAA